MGSESSSLMDTWYLTFTYKTYQRFERNSLTLNGQDRHFLSLIHIRRREPCTRTTWKNFLGRGVTSRLGRFIAVTSHRLCFLGPERDQVNRRTINDKNAYTIPILSYPVSGTPVMLMTRLDMGLAHVVWIIAMVIIRVIIPKLSWTDQDHGHKYVEETRLFYTP